jgi:hypothetical protein
MTAATPTSHGAGSRGVVMVDVARLAGVSQKTVSRVVNGAPHVRPDVRERVNRAIEQLGYRRMSPLKRWRASEVTRLACWPWERVFWTVATSLHLEHEARAGDTMARLRCRTCLPRSVADGIDG